MVLALSIVKRELFDTANAQVILLIVSGAQEAKGRNLPSWHL